VWLLSLHNLAADFAIGILSGMNIEVPHPALKIGRLLVGQCEAAFDWAIEAACEPDDRRGVGADFSWAVVCAAVTKPSTGTPALC
jgi:hypothetical protein